MEWCSKNRVGAKGVYVCLLQCFSKSRKKGQGGGGDITFSCDQCKLNTPMTTLKETKLGKGEGGGGGHPGTPIGGKRCFW